MMRLNIQYFAETSNDIGIRITLDPSTFNTNLAKLRKQITAFQTNINSIKLEDNFTESLSKIEKVLENSESQLDLYVKALSEVKRQMSEVEKAHEDGEISTAEYEKQMTSLIVTQESYKKNISNVKKEIEKYKDIQESAALTGKTFGKRLSEIDSELLKIDKSFNKSVSHLTNWEETTEGLNNKIGSLNKSLTQHQKRLKTLTDEYDRINLKGKASREEKNKLIQEINKEYQAIARTKSEMKKYSDSLNDTERKLKEVERTIESLNREYEKEIKINGTRTKKAQEIRDEVKKQVKEYQKLEEELEDVNDTQEKANKGWTIGKQILADMTRSAIYGAINGFKNLAKSVADASISFESAFAGIRKTVDASEEELKSLEGEILELSKRIPTTADELARVGEIAGQLGIDTENIADFVEVITGMSVAFEGVNADEAAMSLAKFANITKMSQQDYEKLGSVITELGNNYAATEGDIIEMATRIAATGEVVGLSEADIMGLSTAISSVGIEAEAGGTAISKLLKQMNTTSQGYAGANEMIARTGKSLRELELMASNNSTDFKGLADKLKLTQKELKNSMTIARKFETYASTAGITTAELAKIMGEDSVKAMAMFIDGLNDTERNGKNAVEILNDMGLTEVRLSNTILALAGSEQELVDVVGTANKAWLEGTALQKEVDKRYATTESRIQMLKNSFTALSITLFGTFKDSFVGAVSSIQTEMEGLNKDLTGNKGLKAKLEEAGKSIGKVVTILFKALREMLPSLLEFVTELAKLGGRVIPIAIKALTKILKPLTKVATFLAKNEEILIGLVASIVAYNVATKSAIAVTKLYNGVSKIVAVLTKKATISQLGLNAAMTANPVGLVAAGVTILIAGLVKLVKVMKNAKTDAEKFSDTLHDQTEYIAEMDEAYKELIETRNNAIEDSLNEKNSLTDLSDELKTLIDENGNVKEGYEERVDFITTKLSEALGIEIEKTGNIIKNYQDVQKEIDKLIEKKHALAIVEAQEEAANKAQEFKSDENNIKEYNKALEDVEKAQKEIDKLSDKVAELKKDKNYGLKKYYEMYMDSHSSEVELAKKLTEADWEILRSYGIINEMQLHKIDVMFTPLNNKIEDAEKELADFEKILEKEQKELDKIKGLWDSWDADILMYRENLEKVKEGKFNEITIDPFVYEIKLSDNVNQTLEKIHERIYGKDGVGGVTNALSVALDRYNKDNILSVESVANEIKKLHEAKGELIKSLENEALSNEDKNAIKEKIAEIDSLVASYANGSKDIKDTVEGMVQDLIGKFKINRELSGNEYYLLWEQIKTHTAEGKKLTQELLDEWSNSLADSITLDEITAKETTKGLWNIIYDETVIGTELTKAQYDTLMKKIQQAIADGKPLTLAQVQSMLDEWAKALSTNESVGKGATEVKKDIETNMKPDGTTPATNFLSGLVNTFKNSPLRNTLSTVVTGLGSALSVWFNKGQAAKSPSRKAIQSASYFMSGLYKGIVDDEDKILKEVKTFGETLTGTLQDSLGQVRANVSGSVDLGGQVHGSGTANSGTTNNNSKVVNWTQNITQSKPMSRYDMYVENKRVKNQILQEMNAQS